MVVKKSLVTRVLLACACVFLLLTGGCFSEPESTKDKQGGGSATAQNEMVNRKPVPSGEPEIGGRIIMSSLGDFVNMNPYLATDAASHLIISQILVSPLEYDKNLQIVPYAAKSYEVLDGGKRIRITLRKDITWEDGVPLTAKDVEFTFRFVTDPKTPTPYADDFLAVKEFRLIDDYTFEATYEHAYARALISWMSDILPKHVLEEQDPATAAFNRKPIGAGPYRLKEWVAGTRLILEASDTHFRGRPYVSEAVFRVIPDLSTMFLELKAGKLDSMSLTPQQFLYQTKGQKWDAEYNKYRYLSSGYAYLGYNMLRPMFQDVRVRKALTHAIDREGIVKGVLLGLGEVAIGPYKPDTWVYNTQIKPYGYAPDMAKKMLAEAGWTDTDGDGTLDKDGKPFEFTILTNQGNDQRIKTATIIQSQLKAIGIQIKIRTVEWAAFLKEFVHKGRFDAIISGWNIIQDPDISMVWSSEQAKDGGLNHTRYKNPELDMLLKQGQQSFDQAYRKQVYDKVQQILHDDQPFTFLYVPYSLPIVQARFKGIEPAAAGIMHNFERWWVPVGERKYNIAK